MIDSEIANIIVNVTFVHDASFNISHSGDLDSLETFMSRVILLPELY